MSTFDAILAVMFLIGATYCGIKWMKELITYDGCEQEDESEK